MAYYYWPAEPTVALDLETTGLNRERDRIIQYGLFGTHGCSVTALVDAETPTGRDPRNIPQVSAYDVRRARPLREVHLEVLYQALHQRIVVMHNAAHDWAFIEQEFRRHQREPPQARLRVCTFQWARRAQLTGSLKLGDLCRRFGVMLDVAHHAHHDAQATFYLFLLWLNTPELLPWPRGILVQTNSLYFLPPSPPWFQTLLKNTRTAASEPSTAEHTAAAPDLASAFHAETADLHRHIARYQYVPSRPRWPPIQCPHDASA